jgi:ribosomal protein S18 acetylase RimI-like enzyme
MNYNLRKGNPTDFEQVLELIKELALYEKAPQEVTNTVERMNMEYNDGIFDLFVVETNQKIVGIAIYYYRYSTWKGKRLYLEDIIVTDNMRGQGFGNLLLEKTIAEAKATKCTGMMWQVLDWNEPAINFYKKYDTRFDAGWINCHLDF